MGTVAFEPLSHAEQIFKDLVWDPMIKAGEMWVEGTVPFLALPVIKEIDEEVIELITDAIFKQVVLMIDVSAIKLVNDQHQAAYDAASEQLVVLADEKGVDSDEYKKAQADALVALSRFVHTGP